MNQTVWNISSLYLEFVSDFEFWVSDFLLLPVPDEEPTAPGTNCLWLLRFRPDQVHRAPLRGLLIGDRRETYNNCDVWHAIVKRGGECKMESGSDNAHSEGTCREY